MRRLFGRGSILLLAMLLVACGSGGSGGEGGAAGGAGGKGGAGGGGGDEGCLQHLECPLDKPECDDGVCVPCTSDDACEGRGRCDAASGRCVECQEDVDCPSGATCVDSICVECTSDEQCASGICSPEGKCMPPQDCTESSCPAGFACVASVCWPLCDLYGDGEECAGGNVCGLAGIANDRAVAACLPETGSAEEGESCGEEGENLCSVALICSNEPEGRLCRDFCDPARSGTCGEGMECNRVVVGNPEGATAEVGICQPPLRRCENSAECEEDEYCDFGICLPRKGEGTGGPGAACSEGEECISGRCLPTGVCSGSCVTGEECAEGTDCVNLTFDLGGGQSLVAPVCTPICQTDAVCDPAFFCTPTLHATRTKLVSTCLGRAVGVKGAGVACTADTECRSGTCNRGQEGGYCAGRCAVAGDCGQEMVVCRDEAYQLDGEPIGTLSMCGGKSCDRDMDCKDWSCQIRVEGDPAAVAFRCEPPVGTKAGGAACLFDAECRSGSCAQQRCLELCEDDEDCGDEMSCVGGLGVNLDGVFTETPTCR